MLAMVTDESLLIGYYMTNVSLKFRQISEKSWIDCDICNHNKMPEKNSTKPHLTPQPNYEVTNDSNEEVDIIHNNMNILCFEAGEILNICWNCVKIYGLNSQSNI